MGRRNTADALSFPNRDLTDNMMETLNKNVLYSYFAATHMVTHAVALILVYIGLLQRPRCKSCLNNDKV